MANALQPDLKQAERFLKRLDPNADKFTFQVFDDDADRNSTSHRKIYNGTLKELARKLTLHNRAGAGVYVTVNRTNLKGRTTNNMLSVRAVWQEDDKGGNYTFPVAPHITVESSPGKHHRYFLTDAKVLYPLEGKELAAEFRPVQKRLVHDYSSDANAADLTRVLRLPGFFHQKKSKAKGLKGTPVMVKLVDVSDKPPIPWAELLEYFPPVEESNTGTGAGGASQDPFHGLLSDEKITDLNSAMAFLATSPLSEQEKLSADPRDKYWLDVRANYIHTSYLLKPHGDTGKEIWLAGVKHSARNEGNEDYDLRKWGDAKPDHAGFEKIFKIAQERGWVNPRSKEAVLSEAKVTIEKMLEAAKGGDSGAPFEDDSIQALAIVRKNNLAEYMRIKASLKAIKGVSVTELEKSLKHRKDETEELNQLEAAKQAIDTFGEDNLIHTMGYFWAWLDSGVWSKIDDELFKQRVHEILPDYQIKANEVDAITRVGRTKSYITGAALGAPFDGINCLNGELYYLEGQWQLKEHVKENYLIAQIPVNYTPNAKAPRFVKFLNSVFEGDKDKEDKKQLILELIGYTLVSTCRYEQFALLIGSGSNGKSVVLSVVQSLCGFSNVAAVKPSAMGNKFQVAHLQGKLANVVTEIKKGEVIADEALKAIASGETQTAEHKNRDPFEFKPYSTCWFGANHMPHTRDFSDALFRRASVIPFNNKFSIDNPDRDPFLSDKLKHELPGILVLALNAYANVIEKNGKFTQPASSIEASKAWRLEADSVMQFVEECCELDGSYKTVMDDLYTYFESWSSDQGITRISKKAFGNRLLQNRGIDSKGWVDSVKKAYRGIRIKPELLIDTEFMLEAS